MSTLRYSAFVVRETPARDYPKPRLLDRVRDAIRTRHCSRRTEKAYMGWIKRYIFFHGKRHPAEMGAAEVTRFLTWLATDGKVAASTQNQALNALLFLYRVVLEQELPWLDEIVRARRPQYLPVVLTRDEVRATLERLDGAPRLMALLLYGAGLRLLECARLRVKDVDFTTNQIIVRSGKGAKDRVTMLWSRRRSKSRRSPPRPMTTTVLHGERSQPIREAPPSQTRANPAPPWTNSDIWVRSFCLATLQSMQRSPGYTGLGDKSSAAQ